MAGKKQYFSRFFGMRQPGAWSRVRGRGTKSYYFVSKTMYVPFNIPSLQNAIKTMELLYKSLYVPLYNFLNGPIFPYIPFRGTVYAQTLILVNLIVLNLFSVFNFTRHGLVRF